MAGDGGSVVLTGDRPLVGDGEGFASVGIRFFVDQGDCGVGEVHERLGVGAGENFGVAELRYGD